MDREHNSIFHFQSEMKNLNISKASKEQTMMISPRFINVRVKHQHLGHLAKVTNCHQSPVFWLVLTPIEWCWLQIDSHFQALLTTKYDLVVVDFELMQIMHLKHYTSYSISFEGFFLNSHGRT